MTTLMDRVAALERIITDRALVVPPGHTLVCWTPDHISMEQHARFTAVMKERGINATLIGGVYGVAALAPVPTTVVRAPP